jgi:hypothetical protein
MSDDLVGQQAGIRTVFGGGDVLDGGGLQADYRQDAEGKDQDRDQRLEYDGALLCRVNGFHHAHPCGTCGSGRPG